MATLGFKSAGRAKSCVVCRQFKLACDARRTAPDPCSRCVSKNRKCRFDPNFKRIATRNIAQEVADELHTLRAAQHEDLPGQSTTTPHSQMLVHGQSPPAFQHTSEASISSSSSINQHIPNPSQPQWLELAEDEIVLEQVIHGVHVSSNRILRFFYHFDRFYIPHIRFLSKLTSINHLANRSPLLFCTILVTAAERYEGGSDGLYEQLCVVHDLLMAEILQKSIQKLETVHALLILCLWPVPKMRGAYDPSWNYVALAISAASSLNCHYPMRKDEPTSQYRGQADTTAAEMEMSNQAMTWISCYGISVRQAAFLGLAPPLCMPQQTRTIRRSQQLASSILTPADRATIRILDVLSSAQTLLDSIEDVSSHFSMTINYEMQLEAIELQFQENWSLSLKAQLLSAKLYIFGITFTQDLPFDEQLLSQAILCRQMIREKGMKASSAFISTMTDLSNQSIPGHQYPAGILTFHPKHFFSSLMTAAAHVFQFLLSYEGVTEQQESQAIGKIVEAHQILQSFPDHRDAMRACINIENFVTYIRMNTAVSKSSMTELTVRNRLGASVLYDALFRSAQVRNLRPFDGSNKPVSEWIALNDAFADRLPPVPGQRIVSPVPQAWPENNPMSGGAQLPEMAPWVGVWDSYLDGFGVLNEPWVQNDDEFGMAGLKSQMMYPASSMVSGHYVSVTSLMTED